MWRTKAVAIMADDNSQRAIIPGYDCLLVIASNLLRFSIDYRVGGPERYVRLSQDGREFNCGGSKFVEAFARDQAVVWCVGNFFKGFL